jgi:hypothetical protein
MFQFAELLGAVAQDISIRPAASVARSASIVEAGAGYL